MKNLPIGEVLREAGYIDQAQLEKALEVQRREANKSRLGTVLIQLGYITEQQMMEGLGKRLQLPLVALSTYRVDTAALVKIPRQLATKYHMLAIKAEGNHLSVATNDPLNFYALEDIRQITGMELDIHLALQGEIDDAIEFYYAETDAQQAALMANTAMETESLRMAPGGRTEDEITSPVVKLLDSLLLKGYSTNASDIHVEPFEDKTSVRIRVDGMVVDYMTLSIALHQSLVARIKILANMDIAEKRLPQDGHIRIATEGMVLNLRVSVIPTVYGEKAVLRYLTTNTRIDNAGTFGMDETNYKRMQAMLQNPHGIIYVTGPTGSGKTTTLYMLLEHLAHKPLNISTIEDPVERHLPRINQMQVNNVAGLTFESGLRSLLRQDPDIIMVGETRDNETASISVRSAITGHLVLSTLHTNDAVSSIIRLEDMGIRRYLLADALVGMVAQRLVRKVCDNCGYNYAPDDVERLVVGEGLSTLRRGKGCHLCNHTGYRGRLSIHEILSVDRPLRSLIAKGASADALQDYAAEQQGMKPLKDSMMDLVSQGITTVEELIKLTYGAH